ncbi:MAG TPA: hypothetical protein VER17_11210 [Tepidisphaeraceae bacterium]|nr:hypothetical protein [Tepidisphaeraceae bacterium]
MEEPSSEAEAALREAARIALELGVDTAQFEDYFAHGLPDLAYEALRQGVAQRDMPFGFFVHLSRAAELLGLKP